MGLFQADLANSAGIDAGDPFGIFTNEPSYNGLRLNLGFEGNTEQASKTAYGGVFHTLTVTNLPTNGGSITVWPVAASYPTNRLVQVLGNAAGYFYFQEWANGISTSNNPTSFLIQSNMVVEGRFGAFVSNTYNVPDWWLAKYGLPLDDSGAGSDTDGDGQNNQFEYIAGLDPTNAASVFVLKIASVAGQPNQKKLTFLPWASGRTYAPEFRTNLSTGNYATLPGYSGPTTNANEVSVTDLSATQSSKFYRIRITYP
jgi:hypothetical protein